MTETTTDLTGQPDSLDRAAGLQASDTLFDLRRKRPEFLNGAEVCRPSVLAPKDEAGLGAAIRAALAFRMARQNEDAALFDQYQTTLRAAAPTSNESAIADGADARTLDAPYDAIAQHSDLITRTPSKATADDIDRLVQAGLSNQQIVALSELIGFVNFETRVATGLRLLKSAGDGHRGDATNDQDPAATPSEPQTSSGAPTIHLKPLDWIPHIEPVETADATPEQLAAMQVTPSAGKVSPYVRTLAHDPDSYLARTELFNAIMYVDGGLRLQDRELGALGASMHNGCAYCATVHAERHSKYAGSTDAVYALMSGQEDKLSPRDAAIVNFARDLSRTPPRATTAQVRALYDHGFDDFEMIDLIHAIAIFGWANRLMHVLGRSEPT